MVKPSESFMQGMAILSMGMYRHMTVAELKYRKRMTEEKYTGVQDRVWKAE